MWHSLRLFSFKSFQDNRDHFHDNELRSIKFREKIDSNYTQNSRYVFFKHSINKYETTNFRSNLLSKINQSHWTYLWILYVSDLITTMSQCNHSIINIVYRYRMGNPYLRKCKIIQRPRQMIFYAGKTKQFCHSSKSKNSNK